MEATTRPPTPSKLAARFEVRRSLLQGIVVLIIAVMGSMIARYLAIQYGDSRGNLLQAVMHLSGIALGMQISLVICRLQDYRDTK